MTANAVRRLPLLLAAYLLAVAVSVSVLPVLGFGLDRLILPASPRMGYGPLFLAAVETGVGYVFATVLAAPAALAWMIASERRGLRRAVWHALAGASAGAFAFMLSAGAANASLLPLRPGLDLAIAGALGGLAYWVVAGRSAGGCRPARQQSFDSSGGSR